MSRAARLARLGLVALLTVAALSACGKKGPVRPKLAAPATPVQELNALQQGNLVQLAWKLPAGDGDLRGFRVRRLAFDPAEGCPTCRDPQQAVAELDARFPAAGQRIGERLYWRDTDVRPGTGYRYAVTPLLVGGAEGPAAFAHLALQEPPTSPTGLTAEPGEARVALSWSAPELPAGQQLLGYNLYRRQPDRLFPAVPLNAEPLRETRLIDRGLDSGRSYEYRVSAVVRSGEIVVESMATPGVSATPR